MNENERSGREVEQQVQIDQEEDVEKDEEEEKEWQRD